MGFRILYTGFGQLRKRPFSPTYAKQIRTMKENVLREKRELHRVRHIDRVTKAAQARPVIEQLIKISRKDKYLTGYSCRHIGELQCSQTYEKSALVANTAEAAKLLESVAIANEDAQGLTQAGMRRTAVLQQSRRLRAAVHLPRLHAHPVHQEAPVRARSNDHCAHRRATPGAA